MKESHKTKAKDTMNIRTTIRTYWFDTSNEDEAKAYDELAAKIREGLKVGHARNERPRRMKASGTYGTFGTSNAARKALADGVEIELATNFLFQNQWNTVPGFLSEDGARVFDWAEECPPNEAIKTGHYLEQTEEMRDIRRNTLECGYCGKNEPLAKGRAKSDGSTFCHHCLDSAYLKREDLHLLRLLPVNVWTLRGGAKREPLTDDERATLEPVFTEAQIRGNSERQKVRIARDRAKLLARFKKANRTITAEFNGFTWLMDRGINTENVIYYTHTERFSFGWRKSITGDLRVRLLEELREFPYPYDVQETK